MGPEILDSASGYSNAVFSAWGHWCAGAPQDIVALQTEICDNPEIGGPTADSKPG
jgi:hypothetical protein